MRGRDIFGIIILIISSLILVAIWLRTEKPIAVIYKEYSQKIFSSVEATVIILAIVIFLIFFLVNNNIISLE